MKAQEKVLDRIEQSFEILKKAFVYLVAPFFVYYMFSFVFFALLILYFVFSWFFLSIFNTMDYNNFFLFFSNPKIILLISLGMFFWLIYLLLYIPFFIYAIKTIWDFYKWAEKVDFKENFLYSLNRFLNIMKTYWYIFAYVALIPALIFILWGAIFNIGYFLKWDDIYKTIWWSLMWIWTFLFIAFAVYRWIKSTFSVYSAVDSDDFTRENFTVSIRITEKKWWRILWNVMLVWIIVWLLSWIASNFFSLFFSNSSSLSSLSSNISSQEFIKEFMSNFSYFNYFVSWFFEMFISTVGKVFILIFIYVFYKRLFNEYTDSNITVDNKENNGIIVEWKEKIEL